MCAFSIGGDMNVVVTFLDGDQFLGYADSDLFDHVNTSFGIELYGADGKPHGQHTIVSWGWVQSVDYGEHIDALVEQVRADAAEEEVEYGHVIDVPQSVWTAGLESYRRRRTIRVM